MLVELCCCKQHKVASMKKEYTLSLSLMSCIVRPQISCAALMSWSLTGLQSPKHILLCSFRCPPHPVGSAPSPTIHHKASSPVSQTRCLVLVLALKLLPPYQPSTLFKQSHPPAGPRSCFTALFLPSLPSTDPHLLYFQVQPHTALHGTFPCPGLWVYVTNKLLSVHRPASGVISHQLSEPN